jgi:hypothetical protein
MSVVDIRVRNSKKAEKLFNYSAIPFPDDADILSDQIMEQMMMDGSVSLFYIFCGCWRVALS